MGIHLKDHDFERKKEFERIKVSNFTTQNVINNK